MTLGPFLEIRVLCDLDHDLGGNSPLKDEAALAKGEQQRAHAGIGHNLQLGARNEPQRRQAGACLGASTHGADLSMPTGYESIQGKVVGVTGTFLHMVDAFPGVSMSTPSESHMSLPKKNK